MTSSDRPGALAGQVAVITGAGRGIGRSIAQHFAAEGAALVLAARTEADLDRLAKDVRRMDVSALAVPTDVADDMAVQRLVDRALEAFNRIDILVTAAGVASFGPVAESEPRAWDAMLQVNLRAVMTTCRAVLPPMLARGRGSIINVASIAASRAIPGAAAYTATKAGVVGFSRVLAEELRAGGVRVGVLVPGAVDTPLWDSIPGGPDRARMLRPEDVARAAVLMATLPPGATLEEVTLLPAGGIL
jgi:NADP-dependent 3-hydroxy acid dehydrogenase YdfG